MLLVIRLVLLHSYVRKRDVVLDVIYVGDYVRGITSGGIISGVFCPGNDIRGVFVRIPFLRRVYVRGKQPP